MKKLLVLILALSMIFVTGCKKPEDTQNPAGTEKQADTVVTPDTEEKDVSEETPEVTPEKSKEAPSKVETEHIEKPEDIQNTNELEVLIDEFNNTTDPERREELQELLGEFFNKFEGTTVTAE